MNSAAATLILNFCFQGAVLAMVVLGLAIVFGLLGVMNMAHGEFVMLGAYSVVVVQKAGLPLALGIPLALLVTASLGWVTQRLLIRHLADRPFDTLLATWGLSMLIRKAVEAIFGRGYQNVEGPLPGTVNVLGASYPAYRLVLIGVIAMFFVALTIWYARSPAGARVQAMVANPKLAQALGIDTRRMASAAFIIGVMCAGVAGALLAPLVRVEPYMGLDYLLNSFFVLVVGGLGSLIGLILGTGVIGGTQVLFASQWDQTTATVMVLLVAIAFLGMKPNGLVSRR